MFSGLLKHHLDAPSVNIQLDHLSWSHERIGTHEWQRIHFLARINNKHPSDGNRCAAICSPHASIRDVSNQVFYPTVSNDLNFFPGEGCQGEHLFEVHQPHSFRWRTSPFRRSRVSSMKSTMGKPP